MKRIAAAIVALALAATPALGADIGASVGIGKPAWFGPTLTGATLRAHKWALQIEHESHGKDRMWLGKAGRIPGGWSIPYQRHTLHLDVHGHLIVYTRHILNIENTVAGIQGARYAPLP